MDDMLLLQYDSGLSVDLMLMLHMVMMLMTLSHASSERESLFQLQYLERHEFTYPSGELIGI